MTTPPSTIPRSIYSVTPTSPGEYRTESSSARRADGTPSIGILGPLGSGKTTVLRLTKKYLAHRPDVRVVAVSAWPYTTSQAAITAALEALVDELGQVASAPELFRVPRHYVAAIDAMGSGWGQALQGALHPGTPTELLRRIDRVTTGLGLHLLLWVEDLERFAGFDSMRPRRVDHQALSTVRALLHLLDGMHSISVVFASASMQNTYDFEKLARFVEPVPQGEAELIGHLLRRFREDLLTYPDDAVNPAPQLMRRELDDLGRDASWIGRLFAVREHARLVEALPTLLTNPRKLKVALHRCYLAWNTLAGEIDPDDLLVACIPREAEPEVHAWIADHIEELRGGRTSIAGKDRVKDIRGALDRVVRSTGRGRPNEIAGIPRKVAVWTVIEYLVPLLNDSRMETRPQALIVGTPTDYWRRYLAEDAGPSTRRDQWMLQVLTTGDDRTIAALFCDSDIGDIGIYHARYRDEFDAARLLRIFDEMLEVYRNVSPEEWRSSFRVPPELIPVLELLSKLSV